MIKGSMDHTLCRKGYIIMLFNSFEFIIFYPIVTILYFLLPRKIKPLWLLLSSYYFYMCWNARYIVLILFVTLVSYFSGILMGETSPISKRKPLLICSLILNCSVLFTFKYFDFFLENINTVLKYSGYSAINNPFNFILPVGISFYVFQAAGYIVDVYNGHIKAEKNIINFALFISFFPQLVAGPIERSDSLLSQIHAIRNKRLFSYSDAVTGFGTMLWGLFMKMVIADRASIIVDNVFDNYTLYGSIELALAAVLFSIQIYADFAGYTFVAIGAARVLGIHLTENFNTPYFAVSIKDFWNRWHISLSSWFRDYIYIPLGGNRNGKGRKYVNLLITFLISGLWHGASWHFVFWGLLHGLYRVCGELTNPLIERCCSIFRVNKNVFSYNFGRRLITFFLVATAWIFFRSQSLKQSIEYIHRMITRFNPWVMFDGSILRLGLDECELIILIVSLVGLMAISVIRYKKGKVIGMFIAEQGLWFRWCVYIILIVSIVSFGQYGIEFSSAKFIYFDF